MFKSLTVCGAAAAALLLIAGPVGAAGKAKPKVKTEAFTLKISNLAPTTKAKEVKKLEKAVKKVKGVTKVAVSKKKGEMTVRAAVGTDRNAIAKAVESAGFALNVPRAEEAPVPADVPVEDDGEGNEE